MCSKSIAKADLFGIRLWQSVLCSLIFIIYFAGTAFIIMLNSHWSASSYAGQRQMTLDSLREIIGYSGMTAFITAVLAVFLAIAGFIWIYNKPASDFYLSRPMDRKNIFFRIYFEGIEIYVFAYFLGLIFDYIIIASMGYLTGMLLAESLLAFVSNILFFVAVYSLSILALVLCANIIMGVMGIGCFLFGEIVIHLLRLAFISMYRPTYSDYKPVSDFALRFTPVFLELERFTYESFKSISRLISYQYRYDIALLVMIALFTTLAYLAFEKRHFDFSARSIVFPRIRTLVKICVSVLASVVFVLVILEILEAEYTGHEIPILIVTVLLVSVFTSMFMEALMSFNIRAAALRKTDIIIITAITMFLYLGTRMDIFGYNTYIPKASDVEYAAMYQYNDLDYYKNNSDIRALDYVEENMRITDIDAINELARSAVDNLKDKSIYYQGYMTFIKWHLKNGKDVYREYSIPYDVDPAKMDAVTGSLEFKSGYFPWYHDDNEMDPFSLSYVSLNGEADSKITSADFDEFIEAYKKDQEKFCYSYCLDNRTVGMVTVASNVEATAEEIEQDPEMAKKGKVINRSYTVYDGYDNTINYLQKINSWVSPDVTMDIIDNITYSINDGDYMDLDPAHYEDIIPLFNSNRYSLYEKTWHRYDVYTNWDEEETEDIAYFEIGLKDYMVTEYGETSKTLYLDVPVDELPFALR
ncbi:DUF6449 domain-containing protein [Butyrivibrio sp. MC2013]|uniref:DUF6449 domain-containing protein n=1 Tax=Butyrivibrio sp. MC2013 TaxID=1280686 RepID=UPI00041705C5|nr:DUF6449 domain-containing protein [Butyrivibrio sp. MC2013]